MRGSVAALAALAVATIVPAAPADAPLAETKQQLQRLQKDRAAEKTGAAAPSAGLRDAIPTPSLTPPLELPAPRRVEDREKDAKAKSDARRNWLVDGYDRLKDRRTDPLAARRGADAVGGEADKEAPLDPADPDYFLRVYERQRAETIARQEAQRVAGGENRPDIGPGSDAFAPLLREWLAGSPVRGVLQDVAGLGRDTPAAGSAPGVVAPDAGRSARGGGESAFRADASAATGGGPTRGAPEANPFVQALGLPAPTGVGNAPDLSSPVAGLAPPPGAIPAARAAEPEAPRPETRQARPPPAQDAKKYFPQLKKF